MLRLRLQIMNSRFWEWRSFKNWIWLTIMKIYLNSIHSAHSILPVYDTLWILGSLCSFASSWFILRQLTSFSSCHQCNDSSKHPTCKRSVWSAVSNFKTCRAFLRLLACRASFLTPGPPVRLLLVYFQVDVQFCYLFKSSTDSKQIGWTCWQSYLGCWTPALRILPSKTIVMKVLMIPYDNSQWIQTNWSVCLYEEFAYHRFLQPCELPWITVLIHDFI